MNNNKFIKFRLAFLMFLQFFISGITCPIMSLYLINNLNFSGERAGIILSVSGITTILSSILGTLVADKILTLNRLLGLCYLMASINMFIFIFQTKFELVLIVYLLYTLSIGCTNGCVNAIVFKYETNAKKNYGGIQMWGSIGWISSGWLFSIVWLRNVEGVAAMNRLSDALKISAVISMLLFIYTFSLPHKKSEHHDKTSILPKEALAVLKKPKNFFVICLLFVIFSSFQYYLFSISLFLKQNQYNSSIIIPLMSIAQIFEAIGLAFLGYLLLRKDFKFMMTVGLLCNLWRFIALFCSSSFLVVLSALICHGLASAFFFTTACIYLDSQCENHYARAGVQQIAGIVSYGIAASFGSLWAGQMITLFESKNEGMVNYQGFWSMPAIIGIIVIILFVIVFKSESNNVNKL